MTRLVSPSPDLERSHAAYVRELVDRGERFVPYVLAEVGDSFTEYVNRLAGFLATCWSPATRSIRLPRRRSSTMAVSSTRRNTLNPTPPSFSDTGFEDPDVQYATPAPETHS